MNFKKYNWQKEHLHNQTGSSNSYHPKKYNNAVKKNIKVGKVDFLLFTGFSIILINNVFAENLPKK